MNLSVPDNDLTKSKVVRKSATIAKNEEISAEAAVFQKTTHSSTGTPLQNILSNNKYILKIVASFFQE